MKVASTGQMKFCRWSNVDTSTPVMGDVHPLIFFQQHMAPVRAKMLSGHASTDCNECHRMEKYHKVSGRQKQLLKTGINATNFDKTCLSSTFRSEFEKSLPHGHTDLQPVDWQIDLGNHCNSACVMCVPESSSRLAAEFHRIGLIKRLPPANWVEDPSRVDVFIELLRQTPGLTYLHFIGGETLLTPGFKRILRALAKQEFRHKVTLGLTTNLTVWDEEINQLLCEFKQVHLGMSIESMTQVNDYVRYPSNIQSVTDIMHQWISLGCAQDWVLTIRTTPTALTAGELLSIYQFALANNIGVESCNFLEQPQMLRMSVLPMQVRQQISNQLRQWLQQQTINQTQVVNHRDPNQVQQSVLQDLTSYVNYLNESPDETHLLPAMIQYLKKLDQSRGNCVLDYLPQYEELFRSAGY
jgi:sulfatase maturation enzyme AslB (radical SAM superfamily)